MASSTPSLRSFSRPSLRRRLVCYNVFVLVVGFVLQISEFVRATVFVSVPPPPLPSPTHTTHTSYTQQDPSPHCIVLPAYLPPLSSQRKKTRELFP